MKYTLQDTQEDDLLELNIGNETFNIPLATGMTLEEAYTMNTMDGAISFFKKYIRKEVADALTLGKWQELLVVWMNASQNAKKDGDLTPGES